METDNPFEQIAFRDFDSILPEQLRELARETLAKAGSTGWMQHPVGFYHALLFKTGAVSIRLHFWPRNKRPPSSAVTPYHDHVWKLQSCILSGMIENVILSLKQDDKGPYVVADIKQVKGVDSVVPTSERVTIAITGASSYSVGHHYSIAPRIFHCTNVSLDVAALTIVRAEVAVSGGPRTLVPTGYPGQQPARIYLQTDEADTVLQEVQTLLSHPTTTPA